MKECLNCGSLSAPIILEVGRLQCRDCGTKFVWEKGKMVFAMKKIFGPDLIRYDGFFGCESVCGLCIVQNDAGQFVIVCVEIPGNPGTSVTNCAEYLAGGILKKFKIPWNNFVWIEHYVGRKLGAQWKEEDWDLVTFQVHKDTGECGVPSWRPMTEADWVELDVKGLRETIRNTDWGKFVNPC
jgi:hypothetical protein